MFHVEFISLNREINVEFYTYRVLWAIPMVAYPEPYVIVNVFFYISASRTQPPHFPIDVSHIIFFIYHFFLHILYYITNE